MEKKPRINLFALPSQTSLIFGGILAVIGLPLLFSLTGRFALLLPLLPIVVLLFTVWDFLAEPVRLRTRWEAKPVSAAAAPNPPGRLTDVAGDDKDAPAEAWLAQRVAAIAREVGLRPSPILLKTGRRLDVPFAFGAWRQRYLLTPDWLISDLYQASLHSPQQARFAESILHHELAHFANNDVVLTYFARSLLRQTIFVLLTWWFALMWMPVIYQVGLRFLPELVAGAPSELIAMLPPILQAQVLEIIRNPPPQTWTMMVIAWLELTMAVMPLVGGAVFLWLRDFNLLLRAREFYADARADAWLGNLAPLIANAQRWLRMNHYTAMQSRPAAVTPLWQRWRIPHLAIAPPLSWPGREIKQVLRPDPQPLKGGRETVLAQPQLAYGTVTEIGQRAGVIVLLLFLIMTSLLAPAQKGIGSEIGIGIGFLVLAAGLTPSAIVNLPDQRTILRDRWRAIGFYMLVFNSVLLVALAIATVGVLLRPGDLDLAMYAIAGALPTSIAPVIDDPVSYMLQVVLGSLLVYFVGAPLLLYGFLALDFWIKQRVLQWYGAAWLAQRSARVLLLISGVLTVVLWLGVAPLLHMIAFPLIIGLDGSVAAGIICAALCVAAGAWWLWRSDRRYRNRCPACNCAVEVSFQLGLTCPHCGERLQPWLATRE